MTINEKLILFVDYLDISQRKFTKITGLSEGALRSGRSVGTESIIKIKQFYPVLSIDWLLFNKGDMIINPEVELSIKEMKQKLIDYTYFLDDVISKNKKLIANLNKLEYGLTNKCATTVP